MTNGYSSRTHVRGRARGLLPMAEPGPEFRWGLVVRRSQYNKRQAANGEVEHFEHSTRRQELALMERIKRDNMGRVVAVYRDVASAYNERAKRPEYEAALQDLQSKRIDGIAVWRLDRLVRRSSQYRQVLSILEESGGRLFSMKEGIDTRASDGAARVTTRIMLPSWQSWPKWKPRLPLPAWC